MRTVLFVSLAGQLVLCPLHYPFLIFGLIAEPFCFRNKLLLYLTKEIYLGRVAGPFDAVPFTDGFVVLPLNTVPKRDSAERRVIVDLSRPCGTSVNNGIPSDSFLGEPISLSYLTIDSIVDVVVSLGPGCFLYKRDLKKRIISFQ